jgi:hypothetical protein
LTRIRKAPVAFSSTLGSALTPTLTLSGWCRRATGAMVIARRTGVKLSAPATAEYAIVTPAFGLVRVADIAHSGPPPGVMGGNHVPLLLGFAQFV